MIMKDNIIYQGLSPHVILVFNKHNVHNNLFFILNSVIGDM